MRLRSDHRADEQLGARDCARSRSQLRARIEGRLDRGGADGDGGSLAAVAGEHVPVVISDQVSANSLSLITMSRRIPYH